MRYQILLKLSLDHNFAVGGARPELLVSKAPKFYALSYFMIKVHLTHHSKQENPKTMKITKK